MRLNKLFKLLKNDVSLKGKTIRAGLLVGASSAILSSLSLVRSIVLARLLTPEVFGLWAICMMYIRGIQVLTETGFGTALIYKQEGFQEARDTAFSLMVFRGFVLSVATILFAPWVAVFFENEIIQPLISVLALALIFTGFRNINTIYQQKELEFKPLVYLEQLHTLVNFTLVIFLAYEYRNVWALVVANVLSCLFEVIMSYVLIPGRPKFSLNKKVSLELIGYGKYITGLSIVVFVTTELDNAVIGKILGVETLGFYVLAYTLANLPATHFSKVLSRILFPAYSKIQENKPALKFALVKTTKMVAVVTIPICAVFIVFADKLIIVIYGEKWLPAAGALEILAVFGVLRSIGSLNGYVYNAVGKPNFPFFLNLGKLILIALLIVPLTKKYGIEGAAVSVTAPAFLQFFVGIYIVSNMLDAKIWEILLPVGRIFLISAVVTTILFLANFMVHGNDVYSLLFVLSLSGSLFIFALSRDLIELYMALFQERHTQEG